MGKGVVLWHQGDLAGAGAVYDESVALFRTLVERDGRTELAGELARVRLYVAKTRLQLGDKTTGRKEARDAMPILRREVERTGRADLQQVLNWATEALKDVL